MADLEAELDEAYADGEWEEVEAVENEPPTQNPPLAQSTAPSDLQHQVEASEETYVPPPQLNLDESDQDHSGPSDGDAADTSEDSDANQKGHQASEAMTYLTLEDPPSPLSSASSHPPELSSATVPPVDIVNRKPVSGLSAGTSSRFEESQARANHGSARTPSPNGLPSSLNDTVSGVEGPLTPRNDAGPFVFDGSAGRPINIPLETVASTDSSAAAFSSTTQPSPKPTS